MEVEAEADADDSVLVTDSGAAVLVVAEDEPLELDEEPQAVARAATISSARLRMARECSRDRFAASLGGPHDRELTGLCDSSHVAPSELLQ